MSVIFHLLTYKDDIFSLEFGWSFKYQPSVAKVNQ